MNVRELLANDQLKAKAKVETLGRMLLDETLRLDEVLDAARSVSGPRKGTCVEAIELATWSRPELASPECLRFMSDSLLGKAPRVQWESAKVIANVAHLYPKKLDTAIGNLLTNTESPGTVVRWSAAKALGEIISCEQIIIRTSFRLSTQ